MKIRGTTINTPIARHAVTDDTCVSKKPWSSENTVDKLGIVTSISGDGGVEITDCIPVPIKGLKAWVMARQEGEGTPSAGNVRPIIPFEMSAVTIGIDSTEDMPNPTLYSSGTLPENTYGGYVDWLRGVFVQTHEYVVLDGSISAGNVRPNGVSNFYVGGYISSAKQSQPSTGALQSTGMCGSIRYGKGTGGREVYCSLTNVWFNNFTDISTSEEFSAYLKEHPVHIVYPLQTPIEHPLADMPNTEILLTDAPCYVGTDGSKLEIDYVCETQAYIDKKFAELQNAILATGANV